MFIWWNRLAITSKSRELCIYGCAPAILKILLSLTSYATNKSLINLLIQNICLAVGIVLANFGLAATNWYFSLISALQISDEQCMSTSSLIKVQSIWRITVDIPSTRDSSPSSCDDFLMWKTTHLWVWICPSTVHDFKQILTTYSNLDCHRWRCHQVCCHYDLRTNNGRCSCRTVVVCRSHRHHIAVRMLLNIADMSASFQQCIRFYWILN